MLQPEHISQLLSLIETSSEYIQFEKGLHYVNEYREKFNI